MRWVTYSWAYRGLSRCKRDDLSGSAGLICMQRGGFGFQLDHMRDRQFDDCADRHRGLTTTLETIDFVRA